jgi:hypothetical protein
MIEVALSMVLIGKSLCSAVMVYCITAACRGVEGVKSFWVVPRGRPAPPLPALLAFASGGREHVKAPKQKAGSRGRRNTLDLGGCGDRVVFGGLCSVWGSASKAG